jgi:hypothetical protein
MDSSSSSSSSSVTGGVVLCIGQSAILTGQQIKKIHKHTDIFPHKLTPLLVYIDDFGISDDSVRKNDYCYRYEKRCSTYFEGYNYGINSTIVEYIMSVVEACDTDSCHSVTLLYSAEEGLGTGLTAFLVQYFAINMPSVVILTVGILPHLSQGGLPAINTCMVVDVCLSYASCSMLRCMDDTTHLLSSRKVTKSGPRSSVFEDVACTHAADILLAIREV